MTQSPQSRDLLSLYWDNRQQLQHPAHCMCAWCMVLQHAFRLATEDVDVIAGDVLHTGFAAPPVEVGRIPTTLH